MVTGSFGFLGSHLMPLLPKDTIRPRSRGFDLRDPKRVELLFESYKPKQVIHLAANVGGIGYNQIHPAELLYDNAVMGLNIIEACKRHKVKKLVLLGTVCAYPKFTPVPFKEKDLWNGYPEETNAPYGLAKKLLLVASQAYRAQYGLNSIFLLPVNLYGPNDNFGTGSHVIPALINKFVEAKKNDYKEVEIWGTGTATREFLYVKDCARAIKLALDHYNSPEPVNLGSGNEISIKDLAQKIKDIVGYKGRVVYDPLKPDGQPRRRLDTSRAKQFGFEATTSFDEGLKETIKWYSR